MIYTYIFVIQVRLYTFVTFQMNTLMLTFHVELTSIYVGHGVAKLRYNLRYYESKASCIPCACFLQSKHLSLVCLKCINARINCELSLSIFSSHSFCADMVYSYCTKQEYFPPLVIQLCDRFLFNFIKVSWSDQTSLHIYYLRLVSNLYIWITEYFNGKFKCWSS